MSVLHYSPFLRWFFGKHSDIGILLPHGHGSLPRTVFFFTTKSISSIPNVGISSASSISYFIDNANASRPCSGISCLRLTQSEREERMRLSQRDFVTETVSPVPHKPAPQISYIGRSKTALMTSMRSSLRFLRTLANLAGEDGPMSKLIPSGGGASAGRAFSLASRLSKNLIDAS